MTRKEILRKKRTKKQKVGEDEKKEKIENEKRRRKIQIGGEAEKKEKIKKEKKMKKKRKRRGS